MFRLCEAPQVPRQSRPVNGVEIAALRSQRRYVKINRMPALDAQALAQVFASHRINLDTQRFVCAVSGGLDSVVLLHLMAQLSDHVRCMHVHHGLHDDADQWLALCRDTAASLNCEFVVKHVTVDASGNLEERCRELRYQQLANELGADEMLLTAHHMDDQIETFFIQLMRGAGPAGLRSMPVAPVDFSHGTHFRPLLGFTREQLAAYAGQHDLRWTDDPSNRQQRFERNYLRHELLPILFARREGLRGAVNRSIGLINEADHLLEELARIDARIHDHGQRLALSPLLEHDDARVANAIRYWLKQAKATLPNQQRLGEALRQFRSAGQDRMPALSWSTYRVQRYRDDLYLLHQSEPSAAPQAASFSGAFADNHTLKLPPGCGSLAVVLDTAQGICQQSLSPEQLTVQFRKQSEQILRKSGQHQPLKHWFQEYGVPPFLRQYVPLLYYNDELVAIADMWIDPRLCTAADSGGWQIQWRRPKRLFFS